MQILMYLIRNELCLLLYIREYYSAMERLLIVALFREKSFLELFDGGRHFEVQAGLREAIPALLLSKSPAAAYATADKLRLLGRRPRSSLRTTPAFFR